MSRSSSHDSHLWEQLHVINLPEPWNLVCLGTLRDGILFRTGHLLYRWDMADGKVSQVVCIDRLRYKIFSVRSFDFKGEDFVFFNVIPYTESLVPVTKEKCGVLTASDSGYQLGTRRSKR